MTSLRFSWPLGAGQENEGLGYKWSHTTNMVRQWPMTIILLIISQHQQFILKTSSTESRVLVVSMIPVVPPDLFSEDFGPIFLVILISFLEVDNESDDLLLCLEPGLSSITVLTTGGGG